MVNLVESKDPSLVLSDHSISSSQYEIDGHYNPRILFLNFEGKVQRNVKDQTRYDKQYMFETAAGVIRIMKYATRYFDKGRLCDSTNNGATDFDGDDCQAYHDHAYSCNGAWDTRDFKAVEMCCICGGGQKTPVAQAGSVTGQAADSAAADQEL